MGKLEKEVLAAGDELYIAVVIENDAQLEEFLGTLPEHKTQPKSKEMRICPNCAAVVLEKHKKLCNQCRKTIRRNRLRWLNHLYYYRNQERLCLARREKYKKEKDVQL